MSRDAAAGLRDLIEDERRRFNVPGCAVVVVAEGRVVLNEGFGLRDAERARPVSTRTVFPIASATKTFTAALCALLVEDDILSWDRPVREYLDGFAMSDPVATEQLTVLDMLSHRSGLPRHDLLWYADDGDMDRRDLIRALRYLDPNRGFRETFQYNNLLYLAAGELAGHVTGSSYEDAARGRLLEPLGMQRTTFSVDDLLADDDTAVPYVFTSSDEKAEHVPYARLDLIAPAGCINSCTHDMAAWLMSLLGNGVGGAPPLLSPGLLSKLGTPAVPLPPDSSLVVGQAVGYGLGLMVMDYCGHRLLQHGGNIDGFSSQVSFMPAEGCGVVILANRDGTMFRDVLPTLIYDRILGLADNSDGAATHTREKALRHGRAQIRQQEPRAEALPPVRPLTDYIGSYRHSAYGELTISQVGGRLQARYRSLRGKLEHRRLEVFDLVVDLGGVIESLPTQFFHGLDGHVTAAEVVLEQAVAPIRFSRTPADDHLTDELLERLSGTYHLGPLTTTVSRYGRRGLVATVVEGEPRALRLEHDLVFSRDGVRIEFTDDGRVITSAGEFGRQPR